MADPGVGRREFTIGLTGVMLSSITGCRASRDQYGLIQEIVAREGKQDELARLLLEHLPNMEGCLSFMVAEDVENTNRLWITEVWETAKSRRDFTHSGYAHSLLQNMGSRMEDSVMHAMTHPQVGSLIAPIETRLGNDPPEANRYGIIGQITAVEGRRKALARILLEGSVGMPGCLNYVVALDEARKQDLWITEVWENREAHRASLQLPAVQAAIAAGRPLIAGFAARFETQPIGSQAIGRPAGV